MILLIVSGVVPTPSAGPADTPIGRGLFRALTRGLGEYKFLSFFPNRGKPNSVKNSTKFLNQGTYVSPLRGG